VIFPATQANMSLAKRIFLENLDECLYYPKYFVIGTVYGCNSRCIFCFNEWDKTRKSIMSMQLFDKFVDEVSAYSEWIEQVCLNHGGEPTLDKDLATRVQMLKSAGIKKTDISTNGQLLTPQLSLKLIEAGIDAISISINAMTKPTYEKIHRGLNFDVVMNNTMQLFRLRDELRPNLQIRVRMLVLEENEPEVNDWLIYWKKYAKENDRIYAKPPHSFGNQIWQNSTDDVEIFAKQPCVSPFSTLVMQTDGTIGLCCADYDTKIRLGDFSTQTIKDIWNGEKFNKIRHNHANENRNAIKLCRGCNIWERDAVEM